MNSNLNLNSPNSVLVWNRKALEDAQDPKQTSPAYPFPLSWPNPQPPFLFFLTRPKNPTGPVLPSPSPTGPAQPLAAAQSTQSFSRALAQHLRTRPIPPQARHCQSTSHSTQAQLAQPFPRACPRPALAASSLPLAARGPAPPRARARGPLAGLPEPLPL